MTRYAVHGRRLRELLGSWHRSEIADVELLSLLLTSVVLYHTLRGSLGVGVFGFTYLTGLAHFRACYYTRGGANSQRLLQTSSAALRQIFQPASKLRQEVNRQQKIHVSSTCRLRSVQSISPVACLAADVSIGTKLERHVVTTWCVWVIGIIDGRTNCIIRSLASRNTALYIFIRTSRTLFTLHLTRTHYILTTHHFTRRPPPVPATIFTICTWPAPNPRSSLGGKRYPENLTRKPQIGARAKARQAAGGIFAKMC